MKKDNIDAKIDEIVTILHTKGSDYAFGYLISLLKNTTLHMGNDGVKLFSDTLDWHIRTWKINMEIEKLEKKYEEYASKIPV